MNAQIIKVGRQFLNRITGLNARRALVGAVAMSLLLTVGGTTPAAEASPTVQCAYDRPCFDNVYDAVNDALVIQWRGQGDYDKYHFNWRHAGGPVHSHEVRGGSRGQFIIRNAWKGTLYEFSVQGCESVLIGKDNCSPFEHSSFRTNNI